jgi:hypothetical protein
MQDLYSVPKPTELIYREEIYITKKTDALSHASNQVNLKIDAA